MTQEEAVAILTAAGVSDPRRDVARLARWAKAREAADPNCFEHAIAARATRRPVSRIIGERAFWRHDFIVTDAVLDPRPDTETLVEIALSEPFSRLLDLGTGSGCILLSLLAERTEAIGVGIDISEEALDVARQNAARLGVSTAIFKRSDWFGDVVGRYDLIVANPPYITASAFSALSPEVRHDPDIALSPGGDGLDPYRVISAGVGDHLEPGGRLLVEIGFDQAKAVSGLFEAAGLADVMVHPDINGHDRIVGARRR